ncbi:multidrug DMT transporter permease [Cytobacillus firmus]|uniref:EamA family transporter n=1 Tax=Cytobacillus firmus TaxID=1399 RepID=UPI00077C6A2C|nr:EamA family transporter [Cytobacillus firmus]MBG9543165.1 multidrug DMT transporter permease [Cytobacillus firmus]MBG9552468.1 multidrug DMT transporter permease [Cytobacillus firmus]MBG9558871.1 multidrug DMT transporter permease [Cytobacillus firmus]MBG9575453.1 multidrug DMT transporter permease [Cytobacillus firmus]MEC1892949.1 EamA family transporter [Cytobacillus firmus]
MSIILALLAALFASFTAILAKIGIEKVDSNLATAVRTIVVVIMAYFMVLITGETESILTISVKSYIFLILSGLTTGLSWICFFKAIQIGDVSKVVPIDKSSVVLTILLSFIILREPATALVVSGGIVISIGTFVLIGRDRKKARKKKVFNTKSYIFLAVLSAVFAAATNILAKIGIEDVDSNVATFIRTVVIIIFAWGIVLFQGTVKELKSISKKSYLFLFLSGAATGLSWLCYFGALAIGKVSVVNPIDKFSVVLTMILSFIILKEKPAMNTIAGAILITIGTALLIF